MLAATLLVADGVPVFAAGYGPCLDGSTQFIRSGETTGTTGFHGIRSYVDTGTSFHMCTPPETQVDDQNASVGQVAVLEGDGGPGFITLGIVMCDGPLNPPAFCKGYPGSIRFFGEYKECTGIWGSQWDLGAGDNAQHLYTLNHDGSTNQWKLYIDSVLKKSLDDSAVTCLDPDTQSVYGEWQGEAHDRGDGLGIEVSPLRFSTPQIRTTSASWVGFSWGSACDYVNAGGPSSPAQHCVTDDTHDIYDMWTTGN